MSIINNMESEKLDNPTWHSLSETHKEFAIDYNGIKFYQPDYCPFGGFTDFDQTEAGIEQYVSLVNQFFIVGSKPNFNNKIQLNKELVCSQMVFYQRITVELEETITPLLTAKHQKDLLALVNLVQPGYFKDKTSELGNYYGIYKDDKLIAVTGERMKMDEYIEVSAVITHSEHTGKGYAKQLLTYATNSIFDEGKIPYLHVAETNVGAIKLYEKLGFVTRRKISFWNFIKTE